MTLNKIYQSIILVLLLSACTTDFEEINTNPNAPVDVQPSLLLRQVQWDFAEQMSYEGFVAGNLLGQYFTAIDFNLFDRHSLNEPQFGGNPWDLIYVNLRDNEILLEKAINSPALVVYEGPARIMKAYMSAVLTDVFGNVPYQDAFKGKAGNIAPAFDEQSEIYTGANGILDNLERGISAIESYQGAIPLEGDILFNGDLAAWVTFAHSLRLKYLMRISNRTDVANEVKGIFEAGDFIKTNTQNASFDFQNVPPNNFRMSTARVGDYNLYIMSETIEEVLRDLEDPRMQTFFRPTGNDANAYQGFLNGPDASQLSISVGDYSLTGTIFRENADLLDANYMTAAETHFLLAEAAERGFIDANAKTLYETGVELSFAYWSTSLPDDYLSTGAAAYGSGGQDAIEQIISQKWIHNIGNGYEGWIEYRRTGFPKLKTIAASLNGDLIPVRMPYPTTEVTLNNERYQEVASSTNNNSINVAVWWDNN